MRTKTELWKIIQKYYPYYKEPSIKDNIYYISRSTVITEQEEYFLYNNLSNYHDSKTVEEGRNLLSILIDSSFNTTLA